MLCELRADQIFSIHAGQSGKISKRPCIALHRIAIPGGGHFPSCMLRTHIPSLATLAQNATEDASRMDADKHQSSCVDHLRLATLETSEQMTREQGMQYHVAISLFGRTNAQEDTVSRSKIPSHLRA
jgi:hypothetical protein